MKTKFRNIITRNLAAEKWNFVVAIACTLIVSAADLLRPWPLKLIVDNILLGKTLPPSLRSFESFFHDQKVWTTVAVASVLIVLSAVKGFSVYAQTSITSRIGYRIAHALRRELFSHLQRLSLAFHKRSRSGELLTKVTSVRANSENASRTELVSLVTFVSSSPDRDRLWKASDRRCRCENSSRRSACAIR